MVKPGRNEKCPCGSDRKYKNCCLRKEQETSQPAFSIAERISGRNRFETWLDTEMQEGLNRAKAEFFSFIKCDEDLEEENEAAINEVLDGWSDFDRPLDDGRTPASRYLAEHDVPRGERAWLEQMMASRLKLYEVRDLVPGRSLTVRDLHDGREIKLHEKSGSRCIDRWSILAARIVDRGASGFPEMEAGALSYPRWMKASLLDGFERYIAEFRNDDPNLSYHDALLKGPPWLAGAWAAALHQALPQMKMDGEDMVPSEVAFELVDPEEIPPLLEARSDMEREPDKAAWLWTEPVDDESFRSLGTLTLSADRLTLETFTVGRATRGRALIEEILGDRVKHLATTHTSLERLLEDHVPEPPENAIPMDIQFKLAGEFYEKHYRKWIDESIPALDGATPRDASKSPTLRSHLVDMLKDLDAMYQRGIREGQPAYEPSWLWKELGLEEERSRPDERLPRLSHEVLEEQVPGIGVQARQAAERVRARPGFDPRDTMSLHEVMNDLPIGRFIQEYLRGAVRRGILRPEHAEGESQNIVSHLHYLVNWELHRRKTFWVDPDLAWMLGKTDLDIPGDQLRLPFPSFALVFTDRYCLTLAEQLLSREENNCLRGQILQVATVYVTSEGGEGAHAIDLAFTFHAEGDDWPYILGRTLYLDPTAPMQDLVESRLPDVNQAELDPIFTAPETRSLVHLVLNAILYATSANTSGEHRKRGARAQSDVRGPPPGRKPAPESGEVYYLPGRIDIRHVRDLQGVERSREGGELMHRFMVRGHWHRAAPNWKDQRLRWIEPYWKGPPLSAVVERGKGSIG